MVKNRTLVGSSCPICEHRAVLKGYNDLLTVNSALAGSWSEKNRLKPYEVSPSSNKVVIWKCENGHEWSARIADRTRGHGCPYCSGQRMWNNCFSFLREKAAPIHTVPCLVLVPGLTRARIILACLYLELCLPNTVVPKVLHLFHILE